MVLLSGSSWDLDLAIRTVQSPGVQCTPPGSTRHSRESPLAGVGLEPVAEIRGNGYVASSLSSQSLCSFSGSMTVTEMAASQQVDSVVLLWELFWKPQSFAPSIQGCYECQCPLLIKNSEKRLMLAGNKSIIMKNRHLRALNYLPKFHPRVEGGKE